MNVFWRLSFANWMGVGVVCDNVLRNIPVLEAVVQMLPHVKMTRRDWLALASSLKARWN